MIETSIIIRTFNEEKHLPQLLDALELQDYRDFECIVVDSGSSDRTRSIASERATRLLELSSHDFTFGYSLNVGIRAASGRYIVIVSAHTLPCEKTWLSEITGHLKEEKTAMVYGRQLGNEHSKFSELQDLARFFGPKRLVLSPPHFFANNANSAIRKDLWEKHQFDPALPGLEDIEWAKYWMENGYEVVYEPSAAIYHIHQESWRQIRRRYYREAIAARWIGIKSKRSALLEPILEIFFAMADLLKLLRFKGRFFQKAREVLFFRVNKTFGTVKGLLENKPLPDQAARDAVYFDRPSRALVITGPGEAAIGEIQLPELKPGDVLIKTAFTAVCGTDIEIFNGTLGYYKTGMAKYPVVPGHEMSGIISAIGAKVSNCKPGDRVVVECIQSCGVCSECRRENFIGCAVRTELGVIGRNGAYSEYLVVPERFVHVLPGDVDLKNAALCEPIAVCVKGLRRLLEKPDVGHDKSCAVVGAGPLGHVCALILDYMGFKVTVFDRVRKRLDCFSGTAVCVSDDFSLLRSFGLVVEATGNQDALDQTLEKTGAGTRILLLGLPYSTREYSFENIVAYDKMIIGSVGSSARDFEEAIALIDRLDLSRLTSCVMPLDRYAAAWAAFESKDELKVILSFDAVEGR